MSRAGQSRSEDFSQFGKEGNIFLKAACPILGKNFQKCGVIHSLTHPPVHSFIM